MNNSTDLSLGVCASRTISAFPLSIGTSLAFESLFEGPLDPYDREREIPQRVDIKDYKTFWIHIGTLFRNIVGAMTKEDNQIVTVKELKETLAFEIEMIESILAVEGGDTCKPMFYYSDYHSLYKGHHHQSIRMRTDTTDNQKQYRAKYLKVIEEYLKENKDKENLFKFDKEIKPLTFTSSLILTHYAYDLLSRPRFSKLDLLESHTGILKPRHLWYTKYYNGKTLSMIPFQRKLLAIFGDHELFHPMDIRFRRLIIEIATNRGWTAFTTEDKVLYDLSSDIKEIFLLEIFKKL